MVYLGLEYTVENQPKYEVFTMVSVQLYYTSVFHPKNEISFLVLSMLNQPKERVRLLASW